jgi:hypothetical protein
LKEGMLELGLSQLPASPVVHHPYAPEENGIIEHFLRSLKKKYVWQRRFEYFAQAKRAIGQWIEWYKRTSASIIRQQEPAGISGSPTRFGGLISGNTL